MEFNKIANKYNVYKPVDFSEKNNNLIYYQSFLSNTDYICNKIVEGVADWNEYKEEREARAYAREKIRELIDENN